jgi:PhzF family phenazine biosynthesis protein
MTEHSIPLFQVDAFTDRAFAGNPAAVCPLEAWLPEPLMQRIAAENALSETAFFVPRAGDGDFDLRWFTPAVEIDLCGHATLAAAFVLMTRLDPARERVRFHTKSGPLVVTREGARYTLDLPARPPVPCAPIPELGSILGREPTEVLKARDVMAVFATAEDVRALAPDMGRLAKLRDVFGVIATAPAQKKEGGSGGVDADVDFVSRFFAPAKGVPEDPVTGSAHATLVPFWAARLGRKSLRARQVSARGGELACDDAADRVRLGGGAVLVIEGTMRF